MGVILDRTRQCWVLKAKVDGRDKRYTLRKCREGEPSKPIPADVQALADGLSSPRPTPTTTPTTPLAEYMERHLVEYARHSRPRSVDRLRLIVVAFLEFAKQEGIRSLVEVDESVINRYFDWRLKRVIKASVPITPRGVVSDLQLFSGVFTAAKRKRLIPENPITEVVRVLSKAYPLTETTKYLEPEQVKAFIKALEADRASGKIDDHYADLALVMLNTGLRVGAALQIEGSWIDYKNWTLKVPPDHDKLKTGYTASVGVSVRPILERRLTIYGKGRLFPADMTVRGSYHRIKKVAERHQVDFQGGSFNHALRHTIATSLVDVGVPIQVICGQLGQKNVKTTQRYARVRDQAKSEAVLKLPF